MKETLGTNSDLGHVMPCSPGLDVWSFGAAHFISKHCYLMGRCMVNVFVRFIFFQNGVIQGVMIVSMLAAVMPLTNISFPSMKEKKITILSIHWIIIYFMG